MITDDDMRRAREWAEEQDWIKIGPGGFTLGPSSPANVTRCGGCHRPVDPTTPRCERCGFSDGAAMLERGWSRD